MPSTITLSMRLRKEASYTSIRVRERGIREGKLSEGAKMASIISYAIDCLAEFQGGDPIQIVDFPAINALPPESVGIPHWFKCVNDDGAIRFTTSIRASQYLIDKIDGWVAQSLSKQFSGVRTPYRNAAIALLFRFVVLLDVDGASVPVLQADAGEAIAAGRSWTEEALGAGKGAED